jgi:phage baseplate assembly protein V
MTPLDGLNRLLAPLRTRIANMVARAVVQMVNDEGQLQVLQLGVLDGETRDEVERFQNYGLTSVPLNGAEAVVLFVGGRRDHGLAVAVDDRRHRPIDLKPGEVCLYSKHGQRITLKDDGSITIEPAAGKDLILAGGSKKVALVGDVTTGHTHSFALMAPSGGGPVTGTISSATDTISSGAGAERVKA